MLKEQLVVPPEMAELVRWIVETVMPLENTSGWSVTLNGSGAGQVVAEVRRVERTAIVAGERHIQTRDIRNFRFKTPPKPRG